MLVIVVAGDGCSSDTSGPACHLIQGDLVISEIMANPSGDDTGLEWFEIYNTTGKIVDLAGLTVVASKTDGTGASQFQIAELMVAAGAYAVLGDTTPDLKPPYVDYGYGTGLGELRNADGLIALKCGDTVVDQATYATAPDSASLELSGSMAPDALANDSATNWCAATTNYDGLNHGTPGTANEICGGSGPQGMCKDGATLRDVREPAAGDLVVSEVMADPAGSDTAQEWFEVYVKTDVDLNGLELGTALGSPDDTLTSTDCLAVTAGRFLLFARSTDSTMNGGLPAPYQTESLSLTNSGGTIVLSVGGNLVDSAPYASATTGASFSLDPTKLDATSNDDTASWCAGKTTYGAGGKGTPGAANDSCGNTMPGNMCMDGATQRAVRQPVVGDLIISEIMADPAGTDTAQEWLEVYVANDVDLNGVGLGTAVGTPKDTLTDTNCLAVDGGSYLVFARGTDSGTNGGLTNVYHTETLSLVNGGGTVVVSVAGTVLDQVTYAAATTGKTWSLEPTKLDPTANDDTANWCLGVAMYGAGGDGTPGAANPSCTP